MRGLITPAALAARLGTSGLVVLDVRSDANGGGRAAFEAAHIPGARHSDYARDGWRVSRGGAPGIMPEPDLLGALFGRLGLRPSDAIVIVPAGVGASDLAAATRVFWTLHAAGHEALAVLDGGMARWAREGLPLHSGEAEPVAPTTYPVSTIRARAEASGVLAALGTGTALVDARSASYFTGREKASEAKAAGHIPGAMNVDYTTAFDTGTMALKPHDDLKALFVNVPAGRCISYCNTGHTASLNWFVLSQLLGRDDVSLYDGSMTDWTQDASRPVAS